jgi:hypothetical protein
MFMVLINVVEKWGDTNIKNWTADGLETEWYETGVKRSEMQ